MSEEPPENFNSGDVVWVKLGSSWWPGEVKDSEELPNEILDFKKPPLVIVKFFDEDSYEYIKSWANIYPYNCEKKNDFIKKGMAAFRAKVPHMEKFPKDVLTAEGKVGGNPNILSDPAFLPDKKKNYAAEIFGTPSPKIKVNKDKRRSNTNKSGQKDTAHVTHRRFLGVDDYRAYICIQYPGKDRIPGDKEDDEVIRINREPEQEFNCHTCSFTTKRLEVMILHTKSHIQGVYVSSPRKNKQATVRKKKERTKKSRNSDDVIESESSSSDSEPIRERKRKSKSQSAKESKIKKTEEAEKPKQTIDIRNELLAVWDDSSDDDDDLDISLDKLGKPEQKLSQSTLEGVLSGTIVESADEALSQSLSDTLNKSEARNQMADETLEQIRAEVINPTDMDALNKSEALKRSVEKALNQSDEELLNQFEPLNETSQEELNQSTQELKDQTPTDQSKEVNQSTSELKQSTSEILSQLVDEKLTEGNSTEKEILKDDPQPEDAGDTKETGKAEKKMDRDIQEAIKSCFDFDEDEEEDSAIISKAAIGRKIPRVIPIAERRKSKDIIEDDLNRDKILKETAEEGHNEEVDAAFKELMEMTAVPELPEVQNTLKCEQNFHNIKTIKFPDKPEPVVSPPKVTKVEKKDSSEVATKLTNPKKRFVKSFEDFELMQNEIRRKEEMGELPKNEDIEAKVDIEEVKSDEASCSSVVYNKFDVFETESSIELCKLKSKIMSKIIEEANINEESKCKIMAKIQEPKPKSQVEEPKVESKLSSYNEDKKMEKLFSSASRRTPRSKILESYMKDTNSQKAEHKREKTMEQPLEKPRNDMNSNNRQEIVEDRTREATTRKDVPPKKSRWSRRGSHPKKDRNFFLLEDIKVEAPPIKEIQKDNKSEDSAKVDTQVTVDVLETLNKTPTNSNDNVFEEFTSVSTIDGRLMKESPGKKIFEKAELTEEKNTKLLSAADKNEKILPTQEQPDKPLQNDDHENKQLEYKESEKTSSKDEETDNVSLNNEKIEKLSSVIEETDKVSLMSEETEIFSAKDEEIEKLSSNNEETEKLYSKDETENPSKDEDIEKLFSKDEETEKLSSTEEKTGKSSPKDEEAEKLSSKDKETKKLPSKDEIEMPSPKDETTEKLLSEIEGIEMTSLNNEEIIKSASKDIEIEKLLTKEEVSIKDHETDKLSSEDEEIVKLLSKEQEETVKLSKDETTMVSCDDEAEKLLPSQDETEKFFSQDETSKLSSQTEEIEKLSSQTEETEKCSSQTEGIEKLSSQTEEISQTEETEEFSSQTEGIEKLSSQTEEIEKSSLQTEEIEHFASQAEEIENSPPQTEEIDKLTSQTEEIEKLPSQTEEIVTSKNDVTENFPSRHEFSELSSKDEARDKLELDKQETETTYANKEETDIVLKEVKNLPANEVNSLPSTKEEESSTLFVNEEKGELIVTEDYKVVAEDETIKLSPKVCPSSDYSIDKNESVIVDNETPTESNIIVDNDSCVIPAEEPTTVTESDILNSEIVVEEEKVILPEETRTISPSRDVFTPIDNASLVPPKGSLCSPPKKSKKRKISESNVSNTAKSNIVELEVENLSPSEKRKKEDKETSSVLNKDDVNFSNLESSENNIQENNHKSEVVDVGAEVTESDINIIIGPEKNEESTCDMTEQVAKVVDHSKEVEIQCASSSVESFKFSIQTNLSNLTSKEEMSALALATLSEIKADLENSDSNMSEVRVEQPDRGVLPIPPIQPEMVPIEGNLTVVSEKDLADGQVEITSEKVISPKRPVTLSTFSMDFSDSASDSNSNSTNDTLSDTGKCTDFTSKGTEFTSKAMTKQIKKLDNNKKENAYERLELLNILEGNSDSEKKPKEYRQPPKKSIMEDICDFEEHIPSQIVCANRLKRDRFIDTDPDFVVKQKTRKVSPRSTASKLLERLTETKNKATPAKMAIHSDVKIPESVGKFSTKTQSTPPSSKSTRYIVKSKTPASTSRPIILSEQIIKPASEAIKSKPKRMMEDIEDVEAFVIHKDPKKNKLDEEADSAKLKTAAAKSAGKAKILQQTIITPAGEIIQPTVNQAQTDDNIFDINSMPIVLSDEILTPESIENMPIVIGTEPKTTDIEKTVRRPSQGRIITKTTVATPQPTLNRTHTITKHSKPPRILQTVGSKVIKNSPLLPSTAKPGKYIIVPQSGVPANKYISKKPPVIKRPTVPTGILTKIPNIAPEPSGNKIMIVTNQQGQQQRLLLTPAQQKMLGYQNQKVTKTVMKGNVLQKSVLATKSVPLVEPGTSGLTPKSPSIIGQKIVVGTNSGTSLITTSSHQVISNQGRSIKNVTKRPQLTNQKVFSNTPKPQKTILIKNQHGQTVRKIQGTDDELLDKQVAEQLEAIKASSGMKFSSQPKQMETYKITPKATVRRSYSKKVDVKPKLGPPPLTGIQPSPKQEKVPTVTFPAAKKADSVEIKSTPALVTEEPKPDRPLNQLVIQDAVGNQTTITEGQILALPSETVDGQPQSYMLVTLDESGNLTPLNSEALMSLDPNLGLGGDLSNMVLQIDQSALSDRPQTVAVKAGGGGELAKTVVVESATAVPVPEASITTEITESPVVLEQKVDPPSETPQPVIPSTNGDPGQQLIVTGDPIATQKFLESLTEGTTDLANILANADGNSILIQADGQQILINTNSDNQMLLSMNNDGMNVSKSTEGGGNPIFATQPSKNQDILAAALADTDVFQQDQHTTQSKITSQLSPSNALYPMNVGNVLETSLTLSSPIMTPLEVPSTNNKRIPDEEADILTHVPKNVDLPITITDPNISQTVANQQVASLLASELQTNLELTLPISETTISAVSTDMNSPSYVYSLPTLDDSVDMNQKPFNSSMPLLNEDVEDSSAGKTKTGEDQNISDEIPHKSDSSSKIQGQVNSEGCFLEEEEGRFTLGGEMCSSLSEPPPEMFDLPESDNTSKEDDTTDLSTQADTSSEGSCEIPLQPQIVAKSLDLSQNLDSLKRSLEESKEESKKCKFD